MGVVNGTMMYCGGRQSLLQINTECWKFQKVSKTWEPSQPLPRALAGATAMGVADKLWVFGGVVEEDYYESGLLEEIDYYQAEAYFSCNFKNISIAIF